MSRYRSLSLRARLTGTLVLVALASVVLVGGYNLVQARSLLNSAVNNQLEGLVESRAQALSGGAAALKAEVGAIARDQTVVDALAALDAGYERLRDRDVPPAVDAAVDDFYADEVPEAFRSLGLDPPPAGELRPATAAATELQYRYIVDNGFAPDERRELDDPGDGSAYSAAHGRYHPFLRGIADEIGTPDLLLVSIDDGAVVYSVDKRIDFGTSLLDGPYRDSALGEAVVERLAEATVGDAVLVDFAPYVPARAAPTMFVAAAVRSETEVVGAVVTEVPAAVLTALTTGGGDFEDLGLGDTGESYIVGQDGLMRSDSRLLLEDPDEYLERFRAAGYPEESAELIETFGTTAFLQPVDNEAIDDALAGSDYLGRVESYLGDETLAAASPVNLDGVEWVVVAEISRDEAREPLLDYLRRVGLVALVLLPVVAVVAAVLAGTLTRPIAPLVAAADEVAAGDLDVALPDMGRNEIGDLARQLSRVTADLRREQEALADEEREIADLLHAALPPWLAEKVRRGGDDLLDLVDTVTVVSASVNGLPDLDERDGEEVADIVAAVSSTVESAAAEHGLERIRSSSDHHLYLAGLGTDGFATADAVWFVQSLQGRLGGHLGTDEWPLLVRAGLAAGEVAVGVVGEDQISVSVWGDAAADARTLDALAEPGQVLVDGSVASELGAAWSLEQIRLVGFEDRDAFVLVTPVEHREVRDLADEPA